MTKSKDIVYSTTWHIAGIRISQLVCAKHWNPLWPCLVYLKGIHWQLDKLGLKVVFCLDKNDGESHFAELGSSWPGEAKTWPKIALRVGGRAEYSVLEDGRPNSVPPPVPQHSTFPPVLQHVALFLATFWPLLASWSRVRRNDLYHRFRLGQTELLSPTCKIATGSH